MKVIVFGATGFVGQEILRQAIALPSITSVVTVGRRAAPEASSSSKLKDVVLSDWLKYSDDVKKELANADACIWTVGVTPRHLRTMPFEEVRKICLDYTTTALDVLAAEPRKSPLRFIYMSGSAATRKEEDKPWVLGNYSLLRGEVENKVIEYETSQPDRIKAFVVKPGVIQSATRNDGIFVKLAHTFLAPLIGLPTIPLPEAAASTLALAVDGSEEQTLLNADMQRVGAAFITKNELA